MSSSLELIDIAERKEPGTTLAEWSRRIGAERTALNVARVRGHLSPVNAGNLAAIIGESPVKWLTVAALESAKNDKARSMLEKHLRAVKTVLFYSIKQRTQHRPVGGYPRVLRAL